MEKLGALAAFGTAFCWSISAIFFENASKRVGALAVNFWKVFMAFFFLALAGLALNGRPFPLDATPRTWLYLFLSGIIGFLVSDYFLFNAYILIGSRITVVFQALTPLFTALFAFIFLGERMKPLRLLGMAIVVCGILMVVTSRQRKQKSEGKPFSASKKGYIFAFLSAVFQAAGLIFSKTGLGDSNAIAGTQIRVLTAIVGFGLQAILTGRARQVFVVTPRESTFLKNIGIGAVFGPFLGVTLSLFALQNTQAGTASTLMALTPVLIIPPSIFILKQKVQALEMAGAAVAVSGAALFFLL
ncbi:MAG TPA: DMT family transporter [Rectinemataceae bacterium]|nr:DMT family transporter [Rectinemataceae bacterium]